MRSTAIVLSELERVLFPEGYPYSVDPFKEDRAYLHQATEYDKTSMLNIAFKCKVGTYALDVQDAYLRQAIRHLFNSYITLTGLDWNRPYHWYELKSVLWFFNSFSGIRSEKALYARIRKPHTRTLFLKYAPCGVC